MSIIIAVFICIAAYFTVHFAHLSSSLGSAIAILAFAIPSFLPLIKTSGYKKALILLGILSLYAISLETFAIVTGFPYGHFEYGTMIGFKVFGITPWTVPFAWIPLIIGSVTISHHITKSLIKRVLISTFILVLSDIVLDPGAVALGMWKYQGVSFLYNVPLSNFLGWIFSGAIGSLVCEYLYKKWSCTLPIQASYSLLYILFFWTNIALWKNLYISAVVGIVLCILHSYYLYRKKV